MTITRRTFLKVAGTSVLAAGLFGLAGCGSAPQAGNAGAASGELAEFMTQGKGQHLVCGRRGKLFKIAPSVIADKNGYFAEEGCDVEFQQVELAEAFASLSTDKLDIMLMGVVQPCEYIAKGSPMYMFGGTVLNGTEILAKQESDITLESAEDFKGYTIGFHRPETGQVALRAWLIDAGLDIEGGDVTFVPLDNEQALVEVTLKGEVDFCLCNNAFGYINLERGIKVLGSVKQFTGDYPCCRQTASAQAYKEKYLSLVDFEIAMLRGYQVFVNDPESTIAMMAEYSEQDPEYVRAALYGTETYEALMNPLPDPCTNAIVNFYDSLKKVGTIEQSAPSVEEYAVASIYRTALDTLMEREPEEQLWKDLDKLYQENNA